MSNDSRRLPIHQWYIYFSLLSSWCALYIIIILLSMNGRKYITLWPLQAIHLTILLCYTQIWVHFCFFGFSSPSNGIAGSISLHYIPILYIRRYCLLLSTVDRYAIYIDCRRITIIIIPFCLSSVSLRLAPRSHSRFAYETKGLLRPAVYHRARRAVTINISG